MSQIEKPRGGFLHVREIGARNGRPARYTAPVPRYETSGRVSRANNARLQHIDSQAWSVAAGCTIADANALSLSLCKRTRDSSGAPLVASIYRRPSPRRIRHLSRVNSVVSIFVSFGDNAFQVIYASRRNSGQNSA